MISLRNLTAAEIRWHHQFANRIIPSISLGFAARNSEGYFYMPGVTLSRPLLEAGASAKCDFAAADARTGLDFDLDLKFRRGAKLEVGLAAYADASAEFSKFIRASIEGSAFAEARAGVQLQLPLNLFDEFGFSVRAEAIAQAAAGLEVNLGLSVGDFVALAKRDPDFFGVPLEVFMLFLEEVSIGGAFEVNVSASAKAHASISVAGTIIEKAGEKAGFYYTVDAGVGLAAGVGMGGKFGLEFKDFRRFFGRAVDVAVDKTVDDIAQIVAPVGASSAPRDELRKWLKVFAPVAKISLRTAYDLGLKITEHNPGATQGDMGQLCNAAIKTLLEEAQRYIFGRLLDAACDSLRAQLEQHAQRVGPLAWGALLPTRNELADKLLAMPSEPFQDNPDNIQYWTDVVSKTLALVAALGNPDPRLHASVSIVYAASELLLAAIRAKVNTASAYAGAIGAGRVATDTQPFVGNPVNQGTAELRVVIAGSDRPISYDDLIAFLASSAVVDPILAAVPELKGFVEVFETEFGRTGREVLALLVKNAAAFDLAGAGAAQVDPHTLLMKIVAALDNYLLHRFEAQVLPVLLSEITDPNLRLYVHEVLYAAVVYTKDVGLKSLLNWSDPARGFDNEDFTESLAGVLMLLVGRTVVVTGDTFLTALQEGAQKACAEVAAKLRNNHADVARFGIPAELIDIAIDSLEVGGAVLGPLPAETRTRVRRLLYQVFEPIPLGQETSFLERLADDFFIPKEADLRALTDELTAISKERFVLFAREFVSRIGNYILELLEEFILAVVDLILNWENTLANSLNKLAALLQSLESRLVDLNRQVTALFIEAQSAINAFLSLLSGPDVQSKVKSEVKSRLVDKALDELEDNDVYKWLPGGIKSSIRGLVGGAVNAAMQNPIIDPVFDAVRAIASEAHELLPDVRELDPEENLPEQLMELVLNRLETRLRSHFDGGKPGISLALDYTYSVWVLDDIFGNGHWENRHIHISLGAVKVNLNPFLDIVRAAISSLDFYHDALDDACFKLADAMAKELELAATKLERNKKKAKKDSLQRISDEHNNDPKEIAILTPASMEHFTSLIEFRVHLGGVPLSYLGLGEDEANRVLIYLNGNLIPLKSLVVEESLSVLNEERHKADIDFGMIPGHVVGEVTTDARIRNSFVNARARIIADTAASIPTQRSNKDALYRTTSFVFGIAAVSEQTAAKWAYAPSPSTGAARIALKRAYGGDKAGRVVQSYDFDNLRPGALKPASAVQDILANRLPGILLQFRAAPDEAPIVEGVNVFTVVVIEKGGHRHQQSVTFTVGVPVKSRKPRKPRLRIPMLEDADDKLSVNNVSRARIVAANDIASKEIRDEMMRRVVKPAAQPVVSVGRKVKVQVLATTTRLRKEVLIVRDKSGKEVGRHEVEYATATQRNKRLRALGLDAKRLAIEGKRLRIDNVAYGAVHGAHSREAFEVRPNFNMTTAGVKEQLSASLRYLSAQHELNFRDIPHDESFS